jgi:DNA-directed RNA polymerase specialized sigma24 family protein
MTPVRSGGPSCSNHSRNAGRSRIGCGAQRCARCGDLSGSSAARAERADAQPQSCTTVETRHRWLEALRVLGDVRPRQRRLLGLHAGGRTYEEIAAVTGDMFGTIERQLLRARKRLAAAAA